MPQRVRADAEARAAAPDIPRDKALDAAAGQPPAARVDEQRIRLGDRSARLQPRAQARRRLLIERYDPLLAPLPHHAHHASRQVDVLEIETHELAQPDARRVEQLED